MNYRIPDYRKIQFYAKWLKTFAPHLTSAQYNEYIRDAFIWHVFSFEIVPANSFLEGDAARAEFDKVNKDGAQCIRLWGDDEPRPLDRKLKAADIERNNQNAIEFYAVGDGFKWTYIVTHETCCGLGPYFMYSGSAEDC